MTIEQALERVLALSRPASVAQIGGFRPPTTVFTSWFGGNFLGLPEETWPESQSGPMIPLLQIRTDELPYCPHCLQEFQLLTIFYDGITLKTPVENGDGWLLRAYSDISVLKLLLGPQPGEYWPKVFPIHWTLAEQDAPGWEDSWGFDEAAMHVLNASNAASDAHGDLPRCYSTKIGGWPTYIQGAPDIDGAEFVLQIDSEEKPQWMLADNGNIYVYRSSEGVFRMHLDFY
jgi:Domain of unknown function (DUF1963)